MAKEGGERAYEKFAWVLPFAVTLFFFLRGLGSIIGGGSLFAQGIQNLTGTTWQQLQSQDPGLATFIDGTQRETGIFLCGFAVFGMALYSKAFRRRERWAWYTGWIPPLVLLGLVTLVLENAEGGGTYPANAGLLTIDSILLVLVLLGQLLPYRKFFPRKAGAAGAAE